MRYLLLGLVLCLGMPAFAQKDKPVAPELPRNDENNQVYYMDVVTVDETDKSELFRRAMIWVKSYYKNPTGFIEEMDSVNGKLVMKPQFATYRTLKNQVKAQSAIIKYTLVLGFKDGKYRYEIKDVNRKEASYFPIEKLFNESDPNVVDNYSTLTQADLEFEALIKDLKVAMLEPSNKVKKDEW
jgi:hypothetical protein